METLSERLKYARLEAGLTQAQLADLANVSQRTVIRYEKGGRLRSPTIIDALAACVRVRSEWLKSGTGPMELPTEEAKKPIEYRRFGRTFHIIQSEDIYRKLEDLFTPVIHAVQALTRIIDENIDDKDVKSEATNLRDEILERLKTISVNIDFGAGSLIESEELSRENSELKSQVELLRGILLDYRKPFDQDVKEQNRS